MSEKITQIHESMKSQRKRMTQQKKIILELMKGTNIHPTADWVYEESRKQLPKISLGTVYRVLKELSESGLIKGLNLDKQKHFDGFTEPHSHVICRSCGKIEDVVLESDSGLQASIQNLTNYSISEQNYEFYGLCPICQNK